jgi:hypothetical protein
MPRAIPEKRGRKEVALPCWYSIGIGTPGREGEREIICNQR